MHINVTEAAERGRATPPPRVQIGEYMRTNDWAEYSPDVRVLSLRGDIVRPTGGILANLGWLERRIERSTGRQLAGLDRLRWVVAHELGHHKQLLRLGYEQQQRWIRDQYRERDILGKPHEDMPIEREADDFAGRVWPYVKINGHRARAAGRTHATA